MFWGNSISKVWYMWNIEGTIIDRYFAHSKLTILNIGG